MIQSISALDWTVIAVYLVFLILFAVWLSRSQNDREDYYVGGRHMGAWPVAISIMATQCSTNSILGAPAFVAFAAGGGLVCAAAGAVVGHQCSLISGYAGRSAADGAC